MYSHSLQKKGFFGFLLVGLLLLLSWRLPVTAALWEQVDQSVFFALNGSLAGAGAWAKFWAIMNMRYIDLIAMTFLLSFLLMPGVVFERHETLRAVCALFVLLILMATVRWQVQGIAEQLHWSGDSPSLRYTPSFRLKHMFIEMGTKDSSARSFPGDHAGVLMFVAAFYLLRRINAWSVPIVAGTIFFMLPRLFAGAHSFSDDMVGGTLIMVVTVALGYFTPYVACGAAFMMNRVAVPLAERLFWRKGWLLDWREQAKV